MLAEVLIEYKIKSLDKTFRYIVPDSLKDKLKKGMKVKVPFGN
jgi:primosomal protein N'